MSWDDQEPPEDFELSTGRWIQPNRGYIGINGSLDTCQGYDGGLGDDDNPFTPQERRELADIMIARWTAWRDSND